MEYDMESAFNAELARRLAADCAAAMDQASRLNDKGTLELHWEPDAGKDVVCASYCGAAFGGKCVVATRDFLHRPVAAIQGEGPRNAFRWNFARNRI